MSKENAVVAITKHGAAIARRLQEAYPEMDVYYPEKFACGDETARNIKMFHGPVSAQLPALFAGYRGLVGIFSLGAMVRLVAPLLKDKKTDPGVVVIDDKAEHVVSVLSGHLGGANDLARQIAKTLGARPIITTASDVGETLAVDLLGRNHGWEIENFEQVTAVSAAVVNEQRVHIVQEAGEQDWWEYDRPLPAHLRLFTDVQTALAEPFDAALVITERLLSIEEKARLLCPGVLYRPKVIVLGIGCNRGTTAEEIAQVVDRTLGAARLSSRCVRNVATIDIKQDEPGLREFCKARSVPLAAYPAKVLNEVEIPHPSATVFQHVGAKGVSEPAARLSSGADRWAVEKVKSGNVTLSVCLVPSSKDAPDSPATPEASL